MQLRPRQGLCVWRVLIGLRLHLHICMHYAQTVKWKAHLESRRLTSPSIYLSAPRCWWEAQILGYWQLPAALADANQLSHANEWSCCRIIFAIIHYRATKIKWDWHSQPSVGTGSVSSSEIILYEIICMQQQDRIIQLSWKIRWAISHIGFIFKLFSRRLQRELHWKTSFITHI